jgi:glycosyltransferase involved in cell wall biosynthesis
VRALNRIGRPLVIIGDGPDAARLRRLAGPHVRFEGRVSDARVAELLSGCRALVQPSVEEFGIAAVEAQAAGRPVIAARGGGALETIEDGVTGTHWAGDADGLAEAVLAFDDGSIDPKACVDNAARFGTEQFRRELPRVVAEKMAEIDGELAPERTYAGVRRARPRGLGLALAPTLPHVSGFDSARAEADRRGA